MRNFLIKLGVMEVLTAGYSFFFLTTIRIWFP